MSEINLGAELFAVGFFALGGVALGVAALSRRFAWALGLAGAFVVAAAAVGATGQSAGYWLPPLVVGGGYLLLAAARQLRTGVVALLSARRGHAALILATGPLLAMAWVYRVDHMNDAPELDLTGISNVRRPADPGPADYVALTDRGTALHLYRHVPEGADVEIEKQYEANLRAGMPLKLIQTAAADFGSNCHGWVFAAGRFHLRGQDVDTILTDNGYTTAAQPRSGDVIVYRDSLGAVLHSGLVRLADNDIILIESKWGGFGRYMHAAANQPYSGRWEFYHGPREDKTLRIEAGP